MSVASSKNFLSAFGVFGSAAHLSGVVALGVPAGDTNSPGPQGSRSSNLPCLRRRRRALLVPIVVGRFRGRGSRPWAPSLPLLSLKGRRWSGGSCPWLRAVLLRLLCGAAAWGGVVLPAAQRSQGILLAWTCELRELHEGRPASLAQKASARAQNLVGHN